jgi:CRP/FNR family transcriptional regulator
MDIAGMLSGAEIFRGMGRESLERLAATGRARVFEKGACLFMEGSSGSEVYLLLDGEVRLYKTSPEGQEVSLKIVRPQEVFAEVVLFEDHVYPVSAVALGPVRVFALDRDAVEGLLDDRGFRDEFISMLMKKQRYLAGRILYLSSFDVEERFFRFLTGHYGPGPTYTVDLAKKDLASAIGTIPETLSRLINRLKDTGVISWEGRVLNVRKDYLENFMEEGPRGG